MLVPKIILATCLVLVLIGLLAQDRTDSLGRPDRSTMREGEKQWRAVKRAEGRK